MRTCSPTQPRRTAGPRGFTLIECLVYIGVMMLLLGLAMTAFYRCFENMRGLRRNSDDITHALHVGELWRADVRAATGKIQFSESDQTVRIPRGEREISYKLELAQIFRKDGSDRPWVLLMPKVRNSQMTADARSHVTAWRWELELQSLRKPERMRPLFTFLAVPGTGTQP